MHKCKKKCLKPMTECLYTTRAHNEEWVALADIYRCRPNARAGANSPKNVVFVVACTDCAKATLIFVECKIFSSNKCVHCFACDSSRTLASVHVIYTVSFDWSTNRINERFVFEIQRNFFTFAPVCTIHTIDFLFCGTKLQTMNHFFLIPIDTCSVDFILSVL